MKGAAHGGASGARRPVSRVLSAPCGVGRPFLWDACRHAPHATNPDRGAEMPLADPRRIGLLSLFGLAPGGVYPAAPVTRRAVRSCRPVSPLPFRPWFPMRARAVCFLWHCPWGRPRRPLAGTVFPWSPDFPPAPVAERQRSSSRLAIACLGGKPPAVKRSEARVFGVEEAVGCLARPGRPRCPATGLSPGPIAASGEAPGSAPRRSGTRCRTGRRAA